MKTMKLTKYQTFWVSVIFHLMVLLVLFSVNIVPIFQAKEKPHIFQMTEPLENEPEDLPVSTPMELAELPKIDLSPVPQVKIPPPPKIPPLLERPEIISYKTFRKKNPPKVAKTIPSKVTGPTPPIVKRTASPGPPRPTSNPRASGQMERYSAELRSKIDRVWVKPPQLIGRSLVAEVGFTVSAIGKITKVRLRASSGNRAFDQSVLAAFKKIEWGKPTPTGQPHSFTLRFQMSDKSFP